MQTRIILFWVLVVVFFAFVLCFLYWFPQWQLAKWKTSVNYTHGIDLKDFLKLEADFRAGWAQILGGVAIFLGLFATWRTYRLNKEGQITDRFNKAIDHLDYTKALDVRLGGIYALERIARDSKKDHGPVMEVLTAYVREHSPRIESTGQDMGGGQASEPVRPASDIQAVVAVIRRRDSRPGRRPLDLSNTNLLKADLDRTDLRGANLGGANLSGGTLNWSDLSQANLSRACLVGADLVGTKLVGTSLIGANLVSSDLSEANLSGANLSRADMRGANLSGANLSGTNLLGANLIGTKLDDQSDANGLTKLSRTKTLYNASLPTDLLEQISKNYPNLLESPHKVADETSGDSK